MNGCGYKAVTRMIRNPRSNQEQEAEWEAAKKHIGGCSSCREEAEELIKRFPNSLAAILREEKPDSFWGKLEIAVEEAGMWERIDRRRQREIWERISSKPEAIQALVEYLRATHTVLKYLPRSLDAPGSFDDLLDYLTLRSIDKGQKSLIDLRELIGEDDLVTLLSSVVGTLGRGSKLIFEIDFDSLMRPWSDLAKKLQERN